MLDLPQSEFRPQIAFVTNREQSVQSWTFQIGLHVCNELKERFLTVLLIACWKLEVCCLYAVIFLYQIMRTFSAIKYNYFIVLLKLWTKICAIKANSSTVFKDQLFHLSFLFCNSESFSTNFHPIRFFPF